MATYLVNYDLRKPGRNYEDLTERLKQFDYWCHFLDSSWLVVATGTTSVAVRDDLARFIDTGDGLLVMDASSDAVAWRGLSDTISNWIHQHL